MHDNFVMEIFYAELNNNDYCIGLSQLAGIVESDNLIRISSLDDSFIGRKYDRERESWTEEYLQAPEPVQTVTLEDVRKDIQPISEATQITSEDAVTILEYLTVLEEKIDALTALK